MGHGPVGASVRAQLLRDPHAAGAHGRRLGRGGLRQRQAVLRRRGRVARRCRPRPDPSRRADVPVQQPGRPAHPAHGAGRLGHPDGHREGVLAVVPRRRAAHRLRLPRQDAPGAPRRARLRPRVPHRLPRHPARPPESSRRRGRRHGPRGGLVDRHRRAHPRLGPPVHRRFPDQLHPRADPRLQRPRPAQRRGDRLGRRWSRVGRDGADPALRRGPGWSGLVAASRRARPPSCRYGVARSNAPHRPGAGGIPRLGFVARRHRADLLADGRHLPRVLHGRARPGDRRSGGDGRGRPVAPTGEPVGRGDALAGRRRFGAVGGDPPAPRDRFRPGLTWVVLGAGALGAFGLANATWLPAWTSRAAGAAAVVAVLAGPAAYTVNTIATPHTGSIVTAGPSTGFGPGGGGPGGLGGRGQFPGGQFPGGQLPGGGVFPGGQLPGGGGGLGGLLNATTPSAEVVQALQQDASTYRWVAAAVGSQNAAGLQLGSGEPVMSIGGFNGSDPSPTLAEFKEYVAAGQIHYYLASGGGGRGGPGPGLGTNGTAAQITAWVQETYTQVTIGSMTFYDLTAPLSRSGSAQSA
ncbi:MAG: hypothetical protein IPO89_01155 [Actinomycetales bacterium]|nr:hypothetical protein [Candidatus Lutibacillus vidarii]